MQEQWFEFGLTTDVKKALLQYSQYQKKSDITISNQQNARASNEHFTQFANWLTIRGNIEAHCMVN